MSEGPGQWRGEGATRTNKVTKHTHWKKKKKRARMKETVKDGNEREGERERGSFLSFQRNIYKAMENEIIQMDGSIFFFSRTHRRDFVGSFGFFSLSILPFWTKEQKIKRERRREETEK